METIWIVFLLVLIILFFRLTDWHILAKVLGKPDLIPTRELDPNAAVRCMEGWIRSARGSKPQGLKYLSFMGTPYSGPPKRSWVYGAKEMETQRIFVFWDGWRRKLLMVHRAYCSDLTTTEVQVQATGWTERSNLYCIPDYCNEDGSPMKGDEIFALKKYHALQWEAMMAEWFHAVLTNLSAKEQVQAISGTRWAEGKAPSILPSGQVQTVRVDEHGQQFDPEKQGGGW